MRTLIIIIFYYFPQAFQMLSQISKDTTVSRHFQNIFCWISANCPFTTLFLSSCQLTMEKLCRLKPLHSGLSPAVLRDLQWPEISAAAHCQCWRTLLTDLNPGHRAMLYNAMQEVLLSVFSTSLITFFFIFSTLVIICCDSPCSQMLSHNGGGSVSVVHTITSPSFLFLKLV